ncbi:unnamed protein product [Ambrosiozyma monospora]|uniref:Unnamed protein product n=1 Tax=Ambrosiozyma monospora TaxID=43982 RepID=A0A9W6YZV3_AMBMO|nr:unnamed protein product [Ambrosiozyma monospora]
MLQHTDTLVQNSILATDMARHDLYVAEIPKFLSYGDGDGDGYGNELDRLSMLSCLLLKCADISNVCRPLHVSVKWGLSLGEEFKEIANLEKSLKSEGNDEGVDGDIVDPDELRVDLKTVTPEQAVLLVPGLSGSQMFFINRFAMEFFQKIGEFIPALGFLFDQLCLNAEFWKEDLKRQQVEKEKEKLEKEKLEREKLEKEMGKEKEKEKEKEEVKLPNGVGKR